MKTLPNWPVATCRVALILTLIAGPEVGAAGGKGGRSGAAPKPQHAPAMPHAPARPHVSQPHVNPPPHAARPGNANPQAAMQAQAQAQAMQRLAARQRQQRQGVPRSFGNQRGRQAYAYRPGARRPRGQSYANRYTTANQNSRMIVRRLRSTHAMLARLDHDYQGHRVRAMHAINTAVRSISHTSIANTNGRGLTGLASGNGQAIARNQPKTQAKSDAQVRRAAQALRSVNLQLTNGGTMPSQSRASGSVRLAIRELTVALRVR